MKEYDISVKYGHDAPDDFVKDVFKLDVEAYSEELSGDILQLYKRVAFLKDSFILLYHKEELIGYINFFPTSEKLFEELIDKKIFGQLKNQLSKNFLNLVISFSHVLSCFF